MKLSAYIVRVDSGFSPNPFGRVCTLACCKPIIRKNAEPGDIIIGTGSVRDGLADHLIFAMRVRNILPLDVYWRRYPSKRPSCHTLIKMHGDNIWHRVAGQWRCVRGALHDTDNLERDVSGENALVSSEFYYFGCKAIQFPGELLSVVAKTQGHKNTYDPELIARFWKWVKKKTPRTGRIGWPVHFEKAICYSR
ncbi:MAG: hypothetical protein JW818_10415 [Pirellulales bacterium]|nr:hypothetical protein [Pirellulales bacterium]